MSALSKHILELFRGRHDYIAVAKGNAFEPSRFSPAWDLIDRHLHGEQSYGFYLLTADSKAWCTCVDFDNKPDNPNPNYREQATALYMALRSFSLHPLMEVSQSGSGFHVWLFFAQAVEAYITRAWWRGVERRMQTTFREVYPRQDRLAGKGLGNLVRYPLWNKSHFVDPENEFSRIDPEEALSSVVRLNPEDLPMLAFQLGMGELRSEPVQSVVVGAASEAMLPLRVQRLLENKSTLLTRRWNGETHGMKDNSNSAIAMCLCVEMVRLYVPTPEIASALKYWCQLRGAAKGEREDWINLTVTKAYDFILEKNEVKSVDVTTFEGAANVYLDQLEKGVEICLPSGIPELDLSIDGVADGEMCVIAARPGHGKSALAFQWLAHAAKRGRKALVISQEMGVREVGKRRVLSIVTAKQDHWCPAIVPDMRREVKVYHEGHEPVYLVTGCGTVQRVQEVIEQMVTLHGVTIAAVDYLQLLSGRNNADRYEIVTELSRQMKQCAQKHNIPILVLSQLNRAVENRTDNEPKLSDLRESGQIEQDADLILFVQWPFKFSPEADPRLYRIYCAKRRNGPIRTGRVETTFHADRQFIGPHADILGYGD